MSAVASGNNSTQARRHRERALPTNASNARDCALEATRTQGLPFGGTTIVGVACQANAGCMVEGNYFEGVEEPMTIRYAGPTGRMVQRSNVFVGASGAPVVGGIKTIVMQGAGVGKIGF